MRIILDTMGGDNGAVHFVKAGIHAIKEMDLEITFVGDESKLKSLIDEEDPKGKFAKNITVINATQVVEMNDDPLTSMKEKPDSSMAVAMRRLADEYGDALVSAGNTGALLTLATLVAKRIRGIRRAALAPIIPTAGGAALLIDSGANAECTPEYLYQFALMGSFYAENAMNIKKPRVGLLNNGAEEHKGDSIRKETYKLLNEADEKGLINFIGNVEGRDVPLGKTDVVVADGFSGNILLKAMEGTGLFFSREIKKLFMTSFTGKLAGLLVKDKVADFKKKIDYTNFGGAPLLGIKKPVIKAHGTSTEKSIYGCIVQAVDYVDSGMTFRIVKSISEAKTEDE